MSSSGSIRSSTPRAMVPRPISPTRMSQPAYPLSAMQQLEDLRRDVALANRIVHAAGLVSAFGHVSARVPGSPETFVFPTRASPALADPARLLVLDLDGNQL